MQLRPIPFVPEIRVYKAGPHSALHRLAEADDSFGTPYWAHYWRGGLALARHLIDHPHLVAGRSVFDLGTGSGIVALAAAYAGAADVLAADVDPYAVAAAGLNARENGLPVKTWLGDPTRGEAPPADVVTVGDLFYDRGTAARVIAFLDRCAAGGAAVLVGDPWRAHLPSHRLTEIARYAVCELTGAFRADAQPGGIFSFGR
jgi:predicted nicotinamide N-methyase